ncbi:ABC transporter ATP-binding protein [Halosimplex aquaticum]|uniref:Probable branched-chain amino acid transport ATP-binding protein LivG n=1 Tax=Halosimplex aquaticum TaxID=3026162 RepID=A0ABD5YAP4_9EURY|nr:ABC transporter ATP-binding protein [Halosimplex aquaticum]
MTEDGTTVGGAGGSARSDQTPGDRAPDDSQATPEEAADHRDEESASLVVEDLRKSFGGIRAVDGASFSVERGSLTGLIGPNGAGKSTTFNLITGVYEPDGGRVTFEGRDLTGMRTHAIAKAGLVRTFQIARELEEMTVLENLMLAPRNQSGEKLVNAVVPGLRGRVREEERELRERVWETLELFEIDHLAEEHAGNLSGGQRKLLELARALLLDPSMMLLDEPFAGVNPTLEEKLLDRVHDLRDEGLTFLLVEHDMDLIMEHCEHVIVMHQGRVLAEGPPAAIRSNDRVIDAYLGEDV